MEADALNTLGTVQLRDGHRRRAVASHERALRIARELRLGRIHAEALIGLAAACRYDDRRRAHDCLREALAITEEAGFRTLRERARTLMD